jgi:tetratricopeptide (TPR) repeat protein/transcriptional regulator with XRE-family HTH domain
VDDSADLESLVARELRRAIALDGRSLNAVGRAAGFSQGYLSQLLRGRQDLKLQHASRILLVLKVEPTEFLRRVIDAFGAGPSTGRAGGEPSVRGEPAARGSSGAGAEPAAPRADLRETIREIVRQELRAERTAALPGERTRTSLAGDELSAAASAGTGAGTAVAASDGLAERLLAHLSPGEHHPGAARRPKLVGLADFLAEESRRAGFRDVVLAQELAELSVEVADALDPRIYLPSAVLDRQALSRAFLGNARRVASDLFGAERAFQDALFHLERGSESEIVRAEVLSLLGSLRIDQARYAEARRTLEESLDLFRQLGQRHEEGKVLFQISKVRGHAGEPDKAVQILEEAIPIIDEDGDARLIVLARHGLCHLLVEAGDPLEALARFEKSQHLYDRFQDDPWFQLRRTWQEARIHAALGDPARAEPLFEEVREAATERELPYELAMINLELAILHLDQGDAAKVRQLAEEMVPIFRSRELHAHAMAAVYLFQHAARTQTATTSLAKEILLYLRRAQNNPYLPFR